jgi:hypothetical protein
VEVEVGEEVEEEEVEEEEEEEVPCSSEHSDTPRVAATRLSTANSSPLRTDGRRASSACNTNPTGGFQEAP